MLILQEWCQHCVVFFYYLGNELKRGDNIELGTEFSAINKFFMSGINGLKTWSLCYDNDLFLIKSTIFFILCIFYYRSPIFLFVCFVFSPLLIHRNAFFTIIKDEKDMNFVFALVMVLMEVCILNIIIYFKNECCITCAWVHTQGRKGLGGGGGFAVEGRTGLWKVFYDSN